MVVHSDLAYPEGVAAAEILKVGSSAKSEQAAKGGSGIKEIASGGAGAMGVAAVWTLLTLARPVIDGVKESLAAVRMPDADKGKHRMDIDMSAKSVGLVFLVTVVGLLCIFYAFVSPENLPGSQTLTFTVVGVGVAVLMGFFVAATPWRQQVALLLGCVVGALVIAPVLNLLYEAYGFPGALPRPGMDPAQALAVGMGIYLPPVVQTPRSPSSAKTSPRQPNTSASPSSPCRS